MPVRRGRNAYHKDFTKMRTIALIAVMCALMVACDRNRDEASGGGTDVPPSGLGSGERPGAGNPTDEDVMLTDGVACYISDELSLRADEPGVLVKVDENGNYTFVNLDTRKQVDISSPGLPDMVIVECGKEIRPDAVTVVADDGTNRWIAVECGENRCAVVLPYF